MHTCEDCNNIFSRASNLRRHIARAHSRSEDNDGVTTNDGNSVQTEPELTVPDSELLKLWKINGKDYKLFEVCEEGPDYGKICSCPPCTKYQLKETKGVCRFRTGRLRQLEDELRSAKMLLKKRSHDEDSLQDFSKLLKKFKRN